MPDFRSAIIHKLSKPAIGLSDHLKKQKLQKASDPSTPHEALDELADYPDMHIKRAVFSNSSASLPILLKLMGHGIDVHAHPLIHDLHLHSYKYEHPLLHRSLYSDDDPLMASQKLQNLLAFVSHPSASFETLKTMSGHPNVKVIAAVMKNPSLQPELLFSLMGHENPYIRTLVAKHPKSSTLLLSKMIDNCHPDNIHPEKIALASNHKCEAKALAKLADDKSAWVRRCVSKNPNTDVATLSKLAFDTSPFVKVSAMKHQNIPGYILARMAHDTDPSVRISLARSPKATGKVLEKLAMDSSTRIRYFVAGNPNTPSSVLDRLAGDTDSKVRQKVLRNPNVSEQAIEKINSYRYISHETGTPSLYSFGGEVAPVSY